MKRSFYGILGILFLIVCLSQAAPEPVVVSESGRWTIDTEFTHPQQIIMQGKSGNQLMRFWYVIITLTNKTDLDVNFYPKCELMTDTFQIIPESKSIESKVFEQIRKRHRSKYPFLKPLHAADNKILQGENNAIDLAIIWPDFDKKAQNIKIFITGLSNETAVINHPVAKDQEGIPLKVFLRKTLELSYNLKGDPASVSGSNLQFEGKRWIMK